MLGMLRVELEKMFLNTKEVDVLNFISHLDHNFAGTDARVRERNNCEQEAWTNILVNRDTLPTNVP